MLFLGVVAAADVSVAVADAVAVAFAVAIDIAVAVAFNGGIDAFLDSDLDSDKESRGALCVGVDGVVVAGDAAVPSAVAVASVLYFLLPPVLPFLNFLPIGFLLPPMLSDPYRVSGYRLVAMLLPVILVQEINKERH